MGGLLPFQNIIWVICVVLTVAGDCDVIKRSEWGAREPKANEQSLDVIPPHYVVIHHSDTHSCNDSVTCKRLIKSIQNYHMNVKNWSDIGYNFLVGGDGKVYEGRGYKTRGAHCVKFNARSLGVCVLGTFTDYLPNNLQLETVKRFINCTEQYHLADDYHLLGHRQGTVTQCPGNALYDEIKRWPHFDRNPQ